MTAQTLTEYLSEASVTLPEQMEADKVVAIMVALHAQNGGATFNLYFGVLSNQQLYAVSLFPERTVRSQGRMLRPQAVTTFLRKNADILRDPRNSVGCWYNEENDATYLDVSTTLPSRPAAIDLGIRYNQIGIYDLAGAKIIETEGTGEEAADMLPENERLPPLKRG